jgi:hypothetical protein
MSTLSDILPVLSPLSDHFVGVEWWLFFMVGLGLECIASHLESRWSPA